VAEGFMPHAHCYLWETNVMWLHIISDALITLAYLTIPVTLIYIARKRKDLPFDWMFACFGLLILACGATHALEVWTIWDPVYRLSGTLKAITALASIATAILLVRLVPQLLAIPSIATLQAANVALEKEVAERQRVAAELRWKTALLEAQVNSSPDGMLVVDSQARKILQNARFAKVWNTPQEIADDSDDERQLRWNAGQTRDPELFMQNAEALNAHRDRTAHEEIELTDGRVLERYSAPVIGQDGTYYGRIRTVRDITERRASEGKAAAAAD
jgi:PAS domain-containing protein